MNWAIEHSKQKGTRLLCVLAIANTANEDGYAWLKMRNIAKFARSDDRTARRYVRDVEADGEVKTFKRMTDDEAFQMSNLYKLNIPGTEDAPIPFHDMRGVVKAQLPIKPKKAGRGARPGREGQEPPTPEGQEPPTLRGDNPPNDPSSDPSNNDPQDSPPAKASGGRARKPRERKPQESKPRERDVIFDAVALHVFEVEDDNAAGGRIAKIANWLKGSYEGKGKERVGLLAKPATEDHIKLFAVWCKHQGYTAPLDFVKFAEHWRKWATSIKAHAANGGKRVMTLEEYEAMLEEEGANG